VEPTQSTAATISATHTPTSSSGGTPAPTSAVNRDAPSTSISNLHIPVQQPNNDVSSLSVTGGDLVADDIDLNNRPFIQPYGRG